MERNGKKGLQKRKSKEKSLMWYREDSFNVKKKVKASDEKFREVGIMLEKLKIDIKS